MPDEITITLPRNDLGQIIDGLDVLIEQWQATADYLETGEITMDVPIRECSKPSEATNICEHYTQIREYLQSRLSQHE